MKLGVTHEVSVVCSPKKPGWFGSCPDCDWEGPSRETQWEASADIAEHVAGTPGETQP